MVNGETDGLRECYERAARILPQVESFDVIREVARYRAYWRPTQPRIVLLAESHVFTSDDDFNLQLVEHPLLPPGYPKQFVRFVYCLGYGEPDLLVRTPCGGNGTPHFWKVFFSCINIISENADFAPILRTKTRNLEMRLKSKLATLVELQSRGIWLLDASVVGLYRQGEKPDPRSYQRIMDASWDLVVRQQVEQANPDHIVCIGKGVKNALGKKLTAEYGGKLTILRQPNSRCTSREHLETYLTYHRVCSASSYNRVDAGLS